MSAYDPNNIFAKILRGEIPSHKIYEDARTLAFLDIMPRSPGHTLVVPKVEATNLLDIALDDLTYLMSVVRKLAPEIVATLGAEGFMLQQFNGAGAGQTVFHLHMHIVPRWASLPLKPHAGQMEDPQVLAETAEKLRAALAAKGMGNG
ncbi:HIT family protein [Chelatococcus albus]